MPASWQKKLTEVRSQSMVSAKPLKFDLVRVPISSIAQQFYCEAKVDYEYQFGRVTTPEKESGRILHEEIITMDPTTPKDLVRSIKRKPNCLCTFPVYGEVEGLPIIGIPDAVLFQKAKPSHVIELKTTNGDVNRLWQDQMVQVKAYGVALELMGFDCSTLRLSLVRINKNGVSDEVKEKLLNKVARALLLNQIGRTEERFNKKREGQLRIHVLNYARQDALKDLVWAKDYWFMKRSAIPTTNSSKCRSCEFNRACRARDLNSVLS